MTTKNNKKECPHGSFVVACLRAADERSATGTRLRYAVRRMHHPTGCGEAETAQPQERMDLTQMVLFNHLCSVGWCQKQNKESPTPDGGSSFWKTFLRGSKIN